jgi:hypothetical protein
MKGAILTRRTALVGAFSSLFIPPAALSLIQPALAGQEAMTAKERADFHFEEFCKAMDDVKPSDASGWRISGGRDGDEPVWQRRDAVYRLPEPGLPLPIERFKFLSGDQASSVCFLSKPRN